MANPDFKKILINDAYIQWPKLDQCFRYDRMKKEWQRVDQNAQGAAWHCGVLLDAEEAMKLGKELKAHYDECRSRNPSLPPYSKIFGLVKNEDGTMIFNGKKNLTALIYDIAFRISQDLLVVWFNNKKLFKPLYI